MYYVILENNKCFDKSSVFVVELLVSEHKRPKGIEVKEKELENSKDCQTFQEVDKEEDMITIGSRRVIMQKHKHDCQKNSVQGRVGGKWISRGNQATIRYTHSVKR